MTKQKIRIRLKAYDHRVLDQRGEGLDPALDERLLVLGVLVLGVLAEVAVLLGIVDPLGDLGPLDIDHVLELRAELLEAFFGQVGGLVVHVWAPRWGPVGHVDGLGSR